MNSTTNPQSRQQLALTDNTEAGVRRKFEKHLNP
jgi:hypothetical protein